LVTSEVRERRWRAGVPYSVFKQIRDRNEALNCFVGSLAIRRSIRPNYIAQGGSTAPPLPVSPASVPMAPPIEDNMARSTAAPAPGKAKKLTPDWYDDEISKLLTQFFDLKTPDIEKLLKEIEEDADDE
jgi:hypothetical protein